MQRYWDPTWNRNLFWLNYEPCGFICGMMTPCLLIFGMYATTKNVIYPWLGFSWLGLIHMILFNILSCLAIYCQLAAMTTDPGAVSRDAKPLPDDISEIDLEAAKMSNVPSKHYCKRCKCFKPMRAHHCSICKRCIIKHHCPWVNNCIGIGNHKLFLLFLFWVNIVCFYALGLIIFKTVLCSSRPGSPHYCDSPPVDVLLICLLVEAILFGLFTFCMLADQMTNIETNTTPIDRLKQEKHIVEVDINEIFGSSSSVGFAWHWLYPTPVKFPHHVADKILGYCEPCNDLCHSFGYRDIELQPSSLFGSSSSSPLSPAGHVSSLDYHHSNIDVSSMVNPNTIDDEECLESDVLLVKHPQGSTFEPTSNLPMYYNNSYSTNSNNCNNTSRNGPISNLNSGPISGNKLGAGAGVYLGHSNSLGHIINSNNNKNNNQNENASTAPTMLQDKEWPTEVNRSVQDIPLSTTANSLSHGMGARKRHV